MTNLPRKYLAEIGAVGGSKKSKAKADAARANGRKRAIVDEFSSLTDETPQRAAVLRYRARKAKKIAGMKDNA